MSSVRDYDSLLDGNIKGLRVDAVKELTYSDQIGAENPPPATEDMEQTDTPITQSTYP